MITTSAVAMIAVASLTVSAAPTTSSSVSVGRGDVPGSSISMDAKWKQWDGQGDVDYRKKGASQKRPNPCTYRDVRPGEDPGSFLGRELTSGEGMTLMYRECPPDSGIASGFVLVSQRDKQGAAGLPVVSPYQLALEARDQILLPDPTVEMSPPLNSDSPVLVNAPIWWWVTNALATTSRANAGPVWAEATAIPVRTTWRHEGKTTQCQGMGIPWEEGMDEAKPPSQSCRVVYSRPRDMQESEVRVLWRVTWRGSNGDSGELANIVTENVYSFPVYERQVIGTRK